MNRPPEQRPFRFGLYLDVGDGRPDRLAATARRAEALGVDVLLATDHLGSHAALPMLQAAASMTGLRVGTMVLDNELRQPAVLAQELATVDAMTGGRLEIGLGAGWNRPELEAAGIPFDPPAERVRRLKASLVMLRALPDGGSDPADITEAAVDRKVRWIREAAGDRWAELEITISLFDVHRGGGLGEEEMSRSPHYLIGEPTAMAETLSARRERWGISYIALQSTQLETMAPVIRAVKD